MSKNYRQQLEEAAATTKRLVDCLTWLEKKGPPKGRLPFISKDVTRIAGELATAVEDLEDPDKLRSAYLCMGRLITEMQTAREHLFLQLNVLHALTDFGPDPEDE